MSSIHLGLVKAEYAYASQTEDELELEEDALYYLLEDDDTEWHKVMLKTSPSSADPPRIGLVPATYVLPAPVIQSMTALYAYEAQTDDELTISEDEVLDLYEEDGEWSLVGRKAGSGSRGVGYVPTSYIEPSINSSNGPASTPAVPTTVAVTPPSVMDSPPARSGSAGPVDVKTWAVTDIDKKKKRKGTLAIGNGALIFASESDKTGVQQYSLSTVSIIRTEKGKNLILQCRNEERHFQVPSKDLDEMVSRIERGRKDLTVETSNTTSSSPRPKGLTSPTTSLMPSLRAPSAMASPDRPPGHVNRKVSFATPVGKSATALYDFDAQGDDELTVREGETLRVLDDVSDDDWWKCARESNGEEGVVPASYVELEEGQPSGNPEAADAAMTAAAADNAKRRRIQEEEDARLAQQLADQEDSDYHRANAKAADRKLLAARQAEQKKLQEAEAAARRKRESEARSIQRREAERAMTNPGLSSGPMPPKLTARPDSAQSVSRMLNDGPVPPKRPDSAPREGKTKPQGQIRTWRDRTGQFKVDAEFRGLQNGKIRLHKLNGVIIEVPLSKMSTEDVIWLEGATGRSLRSVDPDDLPLAKLVVKSTSGSSSSSKPTSNSTGTSRKPAGPAKRPTDWFDFFLTAGCDLDDCTRYATNFERDRIDESLLTELEPATMRNLGLREGDVIRVRKHIKQKYGSSVAGPTNSQAEQIRQDEELAKQLSGQEEHNIFTNGPNGSLKTTRRGRPSPNRAGSSAVDPDALHTAREMLTGTPQPPAASQSPVESLTKPVTPSSALTSGGFDDDAWTVRPNSTTPQTSVSQSTPISQATAPAPLIEVVPSQPSAAQPSLTDQIFQKIMNNGQQTQAAPFSAPAAPAPTSPGPGLMVSQPTGFNPNAPRGPLAPVASNAPLLNPLIPTNTGMTGFVPTTRSLQPQPTGFAPQPPQLMQPNMTATGMGSQPHPMTMQPTGMASQPNAMMMQPTGMGMQSMMGNASLQTQGMGMLQPQSTGMGMGMRMSPQITGFNPGFSSAPPPPPVPSIPNMYASAVPQSTPSKSFNPSDIFAQMKTGQFGSKNGETGPQDPNKYNALRSSQPVGGSMGMMPNNTFAQQFMPPQPAGMMQPLQPQPTGFAPGGYVMPQQTGMPTQNNTMYPRQQQQPQWRGY
ncbi:hypothetical protein CROQUDRAFT_75775 [Cronartium quercuum f. sp. fusiforme G11]|uniref:Actin cytoskeleton-regulatory complex protein SLA1 n=1 Tax=Cronartium quercuum f. sp. fusiforme G11 TaxID=708437 RepID=A0A9P6NJC8_9BASI|nr:hypothetical protein CROQUDRAFT_75775 [Cronartium quercuum f. sp. fusiforme G11]